MAGRQEQGSPKEHTEDCSFQWDPNSQLYFHASSGFYHDPVAGWYYSSINGLYYKFEDGNYVLLESDKVYESHQITDTDSNEPLLDKSCSMECVASEDACNPRPASEWLEDTLIDLYLTGYTNSATINDDLEIVLGQDGSKDNHNRLDDHTSSERLLVSYDGFPFEEIEESGQFSEDMQDAPESSKVYDEDALWEEHWKAQYGQVILPVDEHISYFPTVDLWDWSMVSNTARKKKTRVARLVGRLMRSSSRPHPSLPSGGGLLKTAAICEAYLDLVRVASGKVYRLRSPNAKYLASLSIYDSSNPTKDWGFPDLHMSMQGASEQDPSSPEENHASEASVGVTVCDDLSQASGQLSVLTKQRSNAYRDRASERRTLHGGFGIGPGQKYEEMSNFEGEEPCSISVSAKEAEAEAARISFGSGSYARRILEGMGWKEGKALGSTMKGLIEPLQAVGNKGHAGLGWNHGRN